MASAFDDVDFQLHRWSVRLSSLTVAGNIGTHADGTRYTYLALHLGPLYYYPAMLGRSYILGWQDDYEDVEALRTPRGISAATRYDPPGHQPPPR